MPGTTKRPRRIAAGRGQTSLMRVVACEEGILERKRQTCPTPSTPTKAPVASRRAVALKIISLRVPSWARSATSYMGVGSPRIAAGMIFPITWSRHSASAKRSCRREGKPAIDSDKAVALDGCSTNKRRGHGVCDSNAFRAPKTHAIQRADGIQGMHRTPQGGDSRNVAQLATHEMPGRGGYGYTLRRSRVDERATLF